MKKLGIVLLTYNRCHYVVEAINVLIPQLIKNSDSAYLLICDNASTDGTDRYIKPLVEKYPEIEYVRHDKNMGARANFIYGINNVDAEYVHLHGDDDLCSPYFVDTILSLINCESDIGIIHFNYLEGQSNLQKISIHHRNIHSNSLIVKFNNGLDFVRKLMISPSFMTSNVFSKDCILEGYNNNYQEDCYGYRWLLCLYTGIIRKKCIYYELPLVVQRYGGPYPEFALNTILGQHRVFFYLEDYIPGITSLWMNEVTKSPNTIRALKSITENRSIYRPFYKEMKICLSTKLHVVCLVVAVFMPKLISVPFFALVMTYYKLKRLKIK